MLNYLIAMLALSLVINLVGFMVAYMFRTDKLTDASYALSFVALITLSLILNQDFSAPKIILSLMVGLWAFRLGGFLLVRIHHWGGDKRFDKMRSNFFKFLRFWVIQGVTVWVVSICSLIFLYMPTVDLEPLSLVGFLMFMAGLLIEATADVQKFHFIINPKNKDKFIHSGLWSNNRHPNYFGEVLVWVGIYVYCSSALTSASSALLSLISPLFIFLMIRFVSGVPILEKQADAKWGSSSSYKKYKKQSGLMLFKLN
jgi:steroid 5-alpha reductase family enzyme